MDPETFDLEVGVPVAAAVKPAGRVAPGRLAAARVARTTYRGGYEGMGEAWGAFDAWLQDNGHATSGEMWEVYAVGPETTEDASKWRTQLNRPLAT